MIKAIIFDFAGVISTDGYWIWLNENVKDIEGQRAYFQKLSEKVDRAAITNKEFIDLIAKKTGIEKALIWPGVFKKIIINYDLLEYIKKLKSNYKIGLLSNFTFQWLDEIFQKYNLSDYFDAKFISSRFKVIKPQPQAFNKILRLLGVSRDQAVFVDDRQVHVDAASALGIKAFLYTSNEKLMSDFENYGISV
jgi:HAD superfamily hydrolase (TIGR01549 family)